MISPRDCNRICITSLTCQVDQYYITRSPTIPLSHRGNRNVSSGNADLLFSQCISFGLWVQKARLGRSLLNFCATAVHTECLAVHQCYTVQRHPSKFESKTLCKDITFISFDSHNSIDLICWPPKSEHLAPKAGPQCFDLLKVAYAVIEQKSRLKYK